MNRVHVRSRSGNLVLAIVGAVYAVSALIVLALFVTDVWSAAVFVDRAIQLGLLGAAACGIWFVSVAKRGLPRLRRG